MTYVITFLLSLLGLSKSNRSIVNGNHEEEDLEEENGQFSGRILNMDVLNVSGSGTPSIEPRQLVRHERVKKLIEQGANSGLGSPNIDQEAS